MNLLTVVPMYFMDVDTFAKMRFCSFQRYFSFQNMSPLISPTFGQHLNFHWCLSPISNGITMQTPYSSLISSFCIAVWPGLERKICMWWGERNDILIWIDCLALNWDCGLANLVPVSFVIDMLLFKICVTFLSYCLSSSLIYVYHLSCLLPHHQGEPWIDYLSISLWHQS